MYVRRTLLTVVYVNADVCVVTVSAGLIRTIVFVRKPEAAAEHSR